MVTTFLESMAADDVEEAERIAEFGNRAGRKSSVSLRW